MPKKFKTSKQRREDLRVAQRKLVIARKEEGRRRVSCYLKDTTIAALTGIAGGLGKRTRTAICTLAIEEYVARHGKSTSSSGSEGNGVARATPQATGPSHKPTEARKRQRAEILTSQDVEAKRKERNITQRIVARLRAKLPSGHPLAKEKDGRGPNIAPRAPRFVKQGDKVQDPKDVLEALNAQTRAWHAKEDEIGAALDKLQEQAKQGT